MQIYLTCGPSTLALVSGCPLYSTVFSLILLYVSQHKSLTVIGQKKDSSRSKFFTIEIHVIGTERRAQARPTCSIFEQWEPWTEPQVNHRSLNLLHSIFLNIRSLYIKCYTRRECTSQQEVETKGTHG
jgi:hypothetical protein